MTPPLGWIVPDDRTPEQEAAHQMAQARMPRFAVPGHREPAGPVKVLLTDGWSAAPVVADVGFVFPRFHQITGSCVGAGGGQALFTLIAVQRLLATSPTKAFVPFWPFDYGRCRSNGGDRGQGDGAMGSWFADTVRKEGVIDAATPGLPTFKYLDGLIFTEEDNPDLMSKEGLRRAQRLEYQWSDGASPAVSKWVEEGRKHPLGTAAEMRSPADMRTAILNGYPGTFACDRFIGNARVQGSGANACVVGKWDSQGGHQQSFHGYWDNPELGPLFWIHNNWPAETYPPDPAGGPICGCWVKEADVAAAFRYHAEVYAFSHLNWFPAQPAMQSWGDILPKA